MSCHEVLCGIVRCHEVLRGEVGMGLGLGSGLGSGLGFGFWFGSGIGLQLGLGVRPGLGSVTLSPPLTKSTRHLCSTPCERG